MTAIVTAWTDEELRRIGKADELQISSRRKDGSLRSFVTIWVVQARDDIYVRSAHGYNNGWFQRALQSGSGRIRVAGVERDTTFEAVDGSMAAEITAAYHAKYDRYGPSIVGTVVSADAVRSTLRVLPLDLE